MSDSIETGPRPDGASAYRPLLVITENSETDLSGIYSWDLMVRDPGNSSRPTVSGQSALTGRDEDAIRADLNAWISVFGGEVIETEERSYTRIEASFNIGDVLACVWNHIHPPKASAAVTE